MRIVIDTNVFVSGVFWKGPPGMVLDACSGGRVDVVLSPAIIDEYRRVGYELAAAHPTLSLDPIIDALIAMARIVCDSPLPAPACSDPDDDKFLAAAMAGRANFVVSGDKALLRLGEYRHVPIVTARRFVDEQLSGG